MSGSDLQKILILVATTTFSHTLGTSPAFNFTSISPRDSSGWGWGSDSSGHSGTSFFDIALTALACMSFGIFLLNLLMNALFLTTTGLTSTGPIITNIQTGTGGGIGTQTEAGATAVGNQLVYIRKKRGVIKQSVEYVQPSTATNMLAMTVLKSIDAMIEKHECLPKVFCDANRQAKIIGHGFQYLMPLYSFSVSYLGKKWGFHREMLPEHLDAILYGVSETNCRSQFSQCP